MINHWEKRGMTGKMQQLEVVDWGVLDYASASIRQQALVAERLRGGAPDRLILVEHSPVVSIGRNGATRDLLLAENTFRENGVEICRSERGGQVTYHGPGQMVAYPVIELREKDLHQYIKFLLCCVAALLREYGLKPVFKVGEPGLWVNGGKIASIGVSVKKWVTSHGVALNVNNDLAPFQWIVPCGKPGERITSLRSELGYQVDMARVKKSLVRNFREAFGYGEAQEGRLPTWLRVPSPKPAAVGKIETLLDGQRLATVCQSACCPNLGECFGRGTATFMILGRECTRQCRFCAVGKGSPSLPDPQEPERVARTAKKLGLRYVVLTSVTRDDLPDGGAGHFAETIAYLRKELPHAPIEVLVPDFMGNSRALETVFQARPDMFNHNVETVSRLYPAVRPQARYDRSLSILRAAAGAGLAVKSGLMLGLGEQPAEVRDTLLDMRRAGCECLTLGQYLAPSSFHAPVDRYLTPAEFDDWALLARKMGFAEVASGPLVRSSYRADSMMLSTESNIPSKEDHDAKGC